MFISLYTYTQGIDGKLKRYKTQNIAKHMQKASTYRTALPLAIVVPEVALGVGEGVCVAVGVGVEVLVISSVVILRQVRGLAQIRLASASHV